MRSFVEVKLREHVYCSFCGAPHTPNSHFPRTCQGCGNITYRNPQPIIAVAVPIIENEKTGLLVIRRGWTGFGGGELALPGGFIEYGETWQRAAVREVREETNVLIDSTSLTLLNVHSVQNGRRIVIACQASPVVAPLPKFAPNEEILARAVLFTPQPLIFDSHTEILMAFFAKISG